MTRRKLAASCDLVSSVLMLLAMVFLICKEPVYAGC